MEPAFKKLAEHIAEQKKIYQALLELARKKQTDLVQGAIESLEAVTKQEEALIAQAGRLEDERNWHAGEIIVASGLNQEATLQDLLQLAPQEEKETLEQLTSDLVEILAELSKYNEENTHLIRQSLQFIKFNVEAMTQNESSTYNAEREIKAEQVARLLDKKV